MRLSGPGARLSNASAGRSTVAASLLRPPKPPPKPEANSPNRAADAYVSAVTDALTNPGTPITCGATSQDLVIPLIADAGVIAATGDAWRRPAGQMLRAYATPGTHVAPPPQALLLSAPARHKFSVKRTDQA